MARSDIVTLLPLDRFAKFLQIDPLHFNSVVSQKRPLRNACDDIWFQHDYQYIGRTSRDSLAMALHQCEDVAAAYLGFSLRPTWFVGEDQMVDQVAAVEAFGAGSINVRGMNKSVLLKRGHIIAGGIRGTTLISAGAAVVYSDADGDGYEETATVTVATDVSASEIHVFYPGENADETWEIRPISNTVSGGVATITFRKEMAVLPELMEQLHDLSAGSQAIDGDDNANFLSTVDVYRVYNDPSQQVTFYSENSCANCGGDGCDACDFTVETGCLSVRNPKLGIVAYRRADWDAVESKYTNAAFRQGREPDRMKVWYYAGWRDMRLSDPHNEMDRTFERLLAYFAISKLNGDAPACDNTRHLFDMYREDMAKSQSSGNGVGQTYQISDSDLANPFGTQRGALDFWRYIQANDIKLVTAR